MTALLFSEQPHPSFLEKHSCDACRDAKRGFSDDCLDCLFLTHLKCGFLRTVLHHECHARPLEYQILPLYFQFWVWMPSCGTFDTCTRYACDRCKLNFHVGCLLLPRTLEHRSHRDPLTLNYFPQHDGSSECYCDACEEPRNPSHWIYFGAFHDFATHLSC